MSAADQVQQTARDLAEVLGKLKVEADLQVDLTAKIEKASEAEREAVVLQDSVGEDSAEFKGHVATATEHAARGRRYGREHAKSVARSIALMKERDACEAAHKQAIHVFVLSQVRDVNKAVFSDAATFEEHIRPQILRAHVLVQQLDVMPSRGTPG